MLEAISWNHYFSTLAIALTAYYLTILSWYFPQKLRRLISGQSLHLKPNDQQIIEPGSLEEKQMAPFEELELAVEELQGILESARTLTNKPRLFQQLTQCLSNHPGLREPAYRVAIQHFLLENIPKTCRLTVSQSEIETLWSRLPIF